MARVESMIIIRVRVSVTISIRVRVRIMISIKVWVINRFGFVFGSGSLQGLETIESIL